jgi:hypothetical protein
LSLILASPAAAQWAVADKNDPAAPLARAFAQVQSKDGYRLQVYRGEDESVWLRFVLRKGFDHLGSCPTYQIDGKAAERSSADGTSCTVGDRWAEFSLGRIDKNRVRSLVLHRLLNGDKISVRFQLKERGYGEASFSLARSKQAVTQAIGKSIRIEAE